MKLKVLCIDDSKSIHAFLKECLSELTESFSSVFDGEQAVQLFESNGSKEFDIIFLDWEMPKKTGPEVLDELKKKGIQIPIVMLTSKNDVADIATVLSKGAHDYIMKPFTKDIIVERLNAVLGRQM